MAGYGQMYHPSQYPDSHGSEEIYDEWGFHASAYVTVDFLLPTGIYIPLDVHRNDTIKKVKQLLWEEAIHHPLFNQLQNQDSYTFVYITSAGSQEEITDEDRHLSEFDLIHELPVLKLIQSQGNIEEKRIIHEIHHLAGIKNENELNIDAEARTFRKDMRDEANKASIRRSSMHWKVLLESHFPPSFIHHLNEQTHVLRDFGLIQLKYENADNTSYTIKVNPHWTTFDLTNESLQTWEQKSNVHLPSNNPDDYVLKDVGKEFIIGDQQIYKFKCLRESMVAKRDNITPVTSSDMPILTMVHVATVRKLLPEFLPAIQFSQNNNAPPVPDKRRNTCCLWQLDMQFYVKVLRAGNVSGMTENKNKLVVHVGLFHGTEPLCPTVYTKEPKITGGEFDWEEDCYFDINTCNLPRNSKLCITICTSRTRAKTGNTKKDKKDNNQKNFVNQNATPIAYVNMMLFDFKAYLKTGKHRLNCWRWPENVDSINLHPRGSVMMNPDTDQAPFIEISLPEYGNNPLVQYPSQEKVLEQAAYETTTSQNSIYPSPSKSHIAQLAEIVKKDRFDDLFDNEKNLLWYLRLDCRENWPEALCKVLCAVKWNNFKNVALAQAMLGAWPLLEPDRAMELLDCQFADENVRDFAVRCLKQLRDDELQQYLMQLVQVLKFDSYLNSSLVRFLLKRAWKNRKIGHFLFWHLRAEIDEGKDMRTTLVNLRFSLILEAYLYGNIPHMKIVHKQFDALNKMRVLNERVKKEFSQKDIKTRALKALQETAAQESFREALSNFEDPLEPKYTLGQPIIDKMKVMNSKMRPLWLVFKEAGVSMERKRSVIYKNGDDLRQDMLTLQIISIMDTLWKSDGLDLRMIPYGCLATGSQSGMIEVVTQSNTIANIQKTRAGRMQSAFRHQTLLEWIESKNKNKNDLDTAIENFTYSCAGYCVATYVLGVGDRHSDNIMVTERGQLFHIDFGHILGNFKSKYGIKRERVPFVLAHDFVHVINKGKTNEKKEFQYFRKLCDHAFCILRKRGHLFITLFSLMLHSGLPELTSLEHLEYLRDTLALHLTEEKALQQFRNKFNKALTDAWSTSVNWFFHNVTKDNK